MSERVRKLILAVWAEHGAQDIARNEVLATLHFLVCHVKPYKVEAMLEWLLRNAITGERFITFKKECGGSNFNLWQELTRRTEYARPLTVQEDLRV